MRNNTENTNGHENQKPRFLKNPLLIENNQNVQNSYFLDRFEII